MDADLLVCLHSIETEMCRCNILLIGNHELFVYMLLYFMIMVKHVFLSLIANCMVVNRVCLTFMSD